MIYHGESGLADIGDTVKQAVMDLGPHKSKFDFICVTGMSGALVGAPVAIRLGIPLVVVRKPGDLSHSSRLMINGGAAHGKYLFLDDFISIGMTFRRIHRFMADLKSAEYAGSYLYENRILSWDNDDEAVVCYSDLDDDNLWNVYVRAIPDLEAVA